MSRRAITSSRWKAWSQRRQRKPGPSRMPGVCSPWTRWSTGSPSGDNKGKHGDVPPARSGARRHGFSGDVHRSHHYVGQYGLGGSVDHHYANKKKTHNHKTTKKKKNTTHKKNGGVA